MANRSILDVLPLDIVELVVREGKKDGLCSLRLVCKALNQLVEPQVFSTLSIRFIYDEEGKWKAIPEFLSSLASGRSPYVRWAKELRLDGLIGIQSAELDPWLQYDSWQGDDREVMLASQKELLVPAIESLLHVEAVHFVAESRGPYQDVLPALAKLPRLRNLVVMFQRYSAFGSVPLAGFSNLTHLFLTGLPMTTHSIDGVKGMIARSPSLVELGLDGGSHAEISGETKVEFSTLVEDAMQPNFSPRLKELRITPSQFNLTTSCAPFLRSLTSLVILNDSTHAQPSFWKALQDSGIHLQKLKVAPLRSPIIDYLLSYSGLRDFTLDWSREETKDVEEIARRFFHLVLPKHRESIRSISFGHTNLGPWTITQSALDEGVHTCKNLKKLTLIYYFPSPSEKHTYPVIPLGSILGGISDNLPQLETLRLQHTRKFQKSFGCGFACGQYFQTVSRAFASHVSKSQVSAQRKPEFFLEAAGTTFVSKPARRLGSQSGDSDSGNGQRYRFHLLNSSDDGDDLQLDGGNVSDCDAYSGDEGFY
ncbi:hypothetical protein MD484_g7356, partial [Candolleomyces efflorescens]